jgi:SAM-dependent methyltransferase
MTGTNADQRDAWNGESGERWVASADRRDAVLSPVADRLLEGAAVEPGTRALDVGCGCGATTLALADAAGPTGSVLGVDLSGPMLALARRRAAAVETVDLLLADAQTSELPGRFELAISRFGTMFFDDPTAAFGNIGRHLVPAGRLCIATWQPLAANEWLVVPGAALLEHVQAPGGPDDAGSAMFAQSDPAVIERILADAGFEDIESAPWTVPLRLGPNIDDAIEHLTDSGPGRAVMEAVAPDRRADALAAVADALRPHHHPTNGVVLHAGILITTGRTHP